MSAGCQHRTPSTFLLTWLLYYQVLGNFAHPSHISSYDVGAVCIQGSKLEDDYVCVYPQVAYTKYQANIGSRLLGILDVQWRFWK
jgi:hypothetical protein